MSLAKALRQRFPQAAWGPAVGPSSTWDIILTDNSDGKGQSISQWNERKLGPEPTPADLARWQAEYAPPAQSTVQEKLAKLGLTADDIRAVLND
jgi:hypothetical protein